jgi:hypothetical protein
MMAIPFAVVKNGNQGLGQLDGLDCAYFKCATEHKPPKAGLEEAATIGLRTVLFCAQVSLQYVEPLINRGFFPHPCRRKCVINEVEGISLLTVHKSERMGFFAFEFCAHV